MSYVVINSAGIQEIKASKLPGVRGIQDLVGIAGEEAAFEAVYNCYSDRSLIVLCDDEFLRKGYDPVMVTPWGVTLQGQLMVVKRQGDDFGLLNQKQIELIKQETALARKRK